MLLDSNGVIAVVIANPVITQSAALSLQPASQGCFVEISKAILGLSQKIIAFTHWLRKAVAR